MSLVEKILMCLEYCEEQNDTSNGEILNELTKDDFKLMKIVVTTMLED